MIYSSIIFALQNFIIIFLKLQNKITSIYVVKLQ